MQVNQKNELIKISAKLADKCKTLNFGLDVAAVYNPLVYAAEPHSKYLELAGTAPKKIIFLGMNPGPWGMAQTGVPFGEIAAVRDWLGINAPVGKPTAEHPKRPIEGFACKKSEVSGRRLWGLFRERFGTPAKFFKEHFVANYCPLTFMNSNGANITPNKLRPEESKPLFEACDRTLAEIIILLKPQWIIGIGGFAKKRIDKVHENFFNENRDGVIKSLHQFSTVQILHPSPASPKANAGWEKEVTKTMTEMGVWK